MSNENEVKKEEKITDVIAEMERIKVSNQAEKNEKEVEDSKKDEDNKQVKDQESKDNNIKNSENKEISEKPKDPIEIIKDLETKLADKNTQMLRIAADFENFKKRYKQEKESLVKFAGENIILNLLPIIDNFERAIDSAKNSKNTNNINNFLSGIEMIYKQLFDFLGKIGVTEIEAKDKPFDPNLHDAVQQEVTDKYPDLTVLEVFQKGYLLHDKVIRPAMVKVSKKA